MRAFPLLLVAALGAAALPAQMTYVDAQAGSNTFDLLTGDPNSWSSPANNGGDGLWGLRTTGPAVPAHGGDCWQSTHAENAPTLVTIVTGLNPGQPYSCYVFMIGKDCENWPIQAGLDPNRMHALNHEDGIGVDPNGNPANTPSCRDFRFRIFLGHKRASAQGDLAIFVDDYIRADAPGGDRVVYDGVGVEPTLRGGSLRYGTGCAGSNGAAPVFTTGSQPTLGNASFSLAIFGGPAAAPAGLLFGATLAPIPFGTCVLEVQPVVSFVTSLDQSGNASIPLGIPNDAALTGVLLHAQAATVDPGGALLNVGALTNTVDLYLGS